MHRPGNLRNVEIPPAIENSRVSIPSGKPRGKYSGGESDFGKIPRGKFSNRGGNFPRPGQNIKNTVLFSLCSAAGEKFSGFSRLYAYLRANLGDKTMICLAEVKIS